MVDGGLGIGLVTEFMEVSSPRMHVIWAPGVLL